MKKIKVNLVNKDLGYNNNLRITAQSSDLVADGTYSSKMADAHAAYMVWAHVSHAVGTLVRFRIQMYTNAWKRSFSNRWNL